MLLKSKHPELPKHPMLSESRMISGDISALANHQNVKNDLLACLESINKIDGAQYHDADVRFHYFLNLNIYSSIRQTLVRVINIDAIAIDALLLATLQNRVKYRQFVRRRGWEAQSLLNLLQAVRLYTCTVIWRADPVTAPGISTRSVGQKILFGSIDKIVPFIWFVSGMHDLERD
jgi:hypothetical protein